MCIRDSGPAATLTSYHAFVERQITASAYLQALVDEKPYTEDDISKYYDDNADSYAGNGIEKSNVKMVNVRHILIQPEGKNDDGTYTLTFDLEPAGASAYYRHQVRTYSGASKNPEFTAVHMVWTIDANWDLLQMDTVESYSVSMSGLGSLNCTSTLTETFTDFGAVTDDQTEFQPVSYTHLTLPTIA